MPERTCVKVYALSFGPSDILQIAHSKKTAYHGQRFFAVHYYYFSGSMTCQTPF